MSEDERKTQPRVMPSSTTEYQYIIVDTKWGKFEEMTPTMKKFLTTQNPKLVVRRGEKYVMYKKGETFVEEDGTLNKADSDIIAIANKDMFVFESDTLYDLLAMYQQDMRLGNLSVQRNEVIYCQHYLDMAADSLRKGWKNSFIKAITKVATLLELSQSANGFLRNNLREQRVRTTRESTEIVPKSGFFGKSPMPQKRV